MAAGKLGWMVVRTVTVLTVVALTKKALNRAWRFVTGSNPPKKPYDPDATWAEMIAWAAASATGVTAARFLASRAVARRWRTWTGGYPPDVRSKAAPESFRGRRRKRRR